MRRSYSATWLIDVTHLSVIFFFFFSSRRRHTRCSRDWSSDVCSSDCAGANRRIFLSTCPRQRSSPATCRGGSPTPRSLPEEHTKKTVPLRPLRAPMRFWNPENRPTTRPQCSPSALGIHKQPRSREMICVAGNLAAILRDASYNLGRLALVVPIPL